jgi:putative membrane protein
MYGYGAGWSIGSLIGSVIWWIIVIAILVWVLRLAFGCRRYGRWQRRGPWNGPWQQNSALDLLKERYAKGEIDKKEFDEKKKDLQE